MAIDTIISNDEIVVIGPPASVTVSTDIGPKGERGAIFFSGLGEPNSSLLSNPKLGDLYINRQPGSEYGTIYVLSAVPGGTTWVKSLKFSPTVYSTTSSVAFTAGSGSTSFLLSNFYPDAPADLNADDILVQATIELNNPAMISISDKSLIENDGIKIFRLDLKAAKFETGTVSALSASPNVNFLITINGGI